MSKLQDARDVVSVTADTVSLTGQRFWLGTRTLPEGDLEADFADGSTARGSKEILIKTRQHLIEAERTADPRTIDADGFLLFSPPGDGPFGLRRGFGGISSRVGDRDGRVGVVVGLDSGPGEIGLRLAVVWLPDADPDAPLPDLARQNAIDDGTPETVAPYGLLALDVCRHEAEGIRDRRSSECLCSPV